MRYLGRRREGMALLKAAVESPGPAATSRPRFGPCRTCGATARIRPGRSAVTAGLRPGNALRQSRTWPAGAVESARFDVPAGRRLGRGHRRSPGPTSTPRWAVAPPEREARWLLSSVGVLLEQRPACNRLDRAVDEIADQVSDPSVSADVLAIGPHGAHCRRLRPSRGNSTWKPPSLGSQITFIYLLLRRSGVPPGRNLEGARIAAAASRAVAGNLIDEAQRAGSGAGIAALDGRSMRRSPAIARP